MFGHELNHRKAGFEIQHEKWKIWWKMFVEPINSEGLKRCCVREHICIYPINLSQDDPKLTHFETKWPFKKSRVVVESCEKNGQLFR